MSRYYSPRQSLAFGPNLLGFMSGMLSAMLLSLIMLIGRGAGITSINIEMILGELFVIGWTPSTWVIGFMLHLIVGGLFGTAYSAGFRLIGKASPIYGLVFAFVHWIFAGIVMAELGPPQPYLFTKILGPDRLTGYFLSLSGWTFLLAHLAFGASVGWICDRVARRTFYEPRSSLDERKKTEIGRAA